MTSPREVTWDATHDYSVGRMPRKSPSSYVKYLSVVSHVPVEASSVLSVTLECVVRVLDPVISVSVSVLVFGRAVSD